MKKTITLLSLCLMMIAGTQTAQAQDVASAKKELTKIFQESGYEVLELSPCKVYLKTSLSDDVYKEIVFAPNEAHWEAIKFGFRADWRIIDLITHDKEETTTYIKSDISIGMAGEEVYSKIAEQLNILGAGCPEVPKEKDITKSDLRLFVFAEQDINENAVPLMEQLKRDLSEYSTDYTKLYEIFLKQKDGESIAAYSATERKEMSDAKPVLEAFGKEYKKQYDAYFKDVRAALPKKQYEAIIEKLTNDPVFFENAKRVLSGKE